MTYDRFSLEQAVRFHQAGQLNEAAAAYRAIIAASPDQADAHHLLGVVLHQQGQHSEALLAIDRAISTSPQVASYHGNLALVQLALGDVQSAVKAIAQAISLAPNQANYHVNAGAILLQAGDFAAAENSYRKALGLKPDLVEAHVDLGNLLRRRGRLEEAADHFRLATDYQVENLQAIRNLASAQQELGRFRAAVAQFDRALQLAPDRVDLHYGRASSIRQMGRLDDAMQAFDQTLSIDPNHAAAHHGRALVHLERGNLADGWRDFARRAPRKIATAYTPKAFPAWNGEPLTGKSILVRNDLPKHLEILFASCIQNLARAAGRVHFECEPWSELTFKNSMPCSSVHARRVYDAHYNFPTESVDYQIPLGDLPSFLRTNHADFPDQAGYLAPDADRRATWAERLGPLNSKPKIGIAWRGHEDKTRAYEARLGPRLADWLPILSQTHACLVNLQPGDSTAALTAFAELGIDVHDWLDYDPQNFLDGAAALIAELDLVISADVTTAVIAAAVGTQCWLLADPATRWCFLTENESTPWFSILRVVSVDAPSTWNAKLSELGSELTAKWGLPQPVRKSDARVETILREAEDQSTSTRPPTAADIDVDDPDTRCRLQRKRNIAEAVRIRVEGRIDDAERILKGVLDEDPNCHQALFHLGTIMRDTGRGDRAIELFKSALALHDDDPRYFVFSTVCLHEANRRDEAIAVSRRCIRKFPDCPEAYLNMGAMLERSCLYREAQVFVDRGVELAPRSAAAAYNRANVYYHLGDQREALAAYKKSVELNPEAPRAQWNYGLSLLFNQEFADGWPQYEWREPSGEVKLMKVDLPVWNGEPLTGKSILAMREQGAGDEIMFGSCLPDLLREGARVTIACDHRLAPLFARSFPTAEISPFSLRKVSSWQQPPGLDYVVHFGSLPLHYRRGWEKFPRRPYLVPDAAARSKWRRRYDDLGPTAKIGISWRGGGRASEQKRRTTLLQEWLPLFRQEGVDFINLQYGDCTDDIQLAYEKWGVTIHDWEDADPFSNLDDFAAQVAELDLVISVGNTTIHMAGALGTETWTLLPRVPGWRYMAEGEEMPWYGSVKLFRQKSDDAWLELFEQTSARLANWLQERHSGAPSTPTSTPLPASSSTVDHNDGQTTVAAPATTDLPKIDHLVNRMAKQNDRTGDAAAALTQAVSSRGDSPIDQYNRGTALLEQGEFEAAQSHFRAALAAAPDLHQARLNLGVALAESGQHSAAADCFREHLDARPQEPQAHANLAFTYQKLEQTDDAVRHARRAAELAPTDVAINRRTAQLMECAGNYNEAIQLRRDISGRHPSAPELKRELAESHLRLGNWTDGWEAWRAANHSKTAGSESEHPWNGAPLGGKSVRVVADGELSMQLLFSQCIVEVDAESAHCEICCDREIVPLLRRTCPTADVYCQDDAYQPVGAAHPFDFTIHTNQLGPILRPSAAAFPNPPRALVVEDRRISSLRQQLHAASPTSTIGIAIDPAPHENTLGHPGNEYIFDALAHTNALTVDVVTGELVSASGQRIAKQSSRPLWSTISRKNLDELAARLTAVDRVVTTSEFIAQLAGAVGAPTTLILDSSHAFFWMFDGDASPWYPSVRLIRSAARADRQTLVAELARRSPARHHSARQSA